MANVAALLSQYLNTKADINFYNAVLMEWTRKYEANQEKLEVQVKYCEKWEKAFDSAMYNDRELSCRGVVVGKNNEDERIADAYADAKVYQYDEELSEELQDLDVDYDTMKTMYETLLESLRAQAEGEKNATSTAAQDTGLLQS